MIAENGTAQKAQAPDADGPLHLCSKNVLDVADGLYSLGLWFMARGVQCTDKSQL
jgi:hypothetical protein